MMNYLKYRNHKNKQVNNTRVPKVKNSLLELKKHLKPIRIFCKWYGQIRKTTKEARIIGNQNMLKLHTEGEANQINYKYKKKSKKL